MLWLSCEPLKGLCNLHCLQNIWASLKVIVPYNVFWKMLKAINSSLLKFTPKEWILNMSKLVFIGVTNLWNFFIILEKGTIKCVNTNCSNKGSEAVSLHRSEYLSRFPHWYFLFCSNAWFCCPVLYPFS